MNSLKAQFGQKIASLRVAQNRTQASLAKATGVSVDTISNIERGVHGPRFELLERLADALGMPVMKLFDFD